MMREKEKKKERKKGRKKERRAERCNDSEFELPTRLLPVPL
jgi:hypothetical protein